MQELSNARILSVGQDGEKHTKKLEKIGKKGTTTSTNQSQTHRGFVTLPYIQGTSEKIARTLNQFNINVAHKPVTTVGSILRKPKDKFSRDLSTGVSYKINVKTVTKFISVKRLEP